MATNFNSSIPQFMLKATVMLLLSMISSLSVADVSESTLTHSIVSIQTSNGRAVIDEGSGFVAQADRFNGYVVTSAELVRDAASISVRVPIGGGRLIAQVIVSDLSSDFALLKVNGLNLPSLTFSQRGPSSGEVVWSAAKLADSDKVTLSKGLLRTEFKITPEEAGWYQHTAGVGGNQGAVLLNECGQVVGLDFSRAAGDGSTRAIDLESLRNMLAAQNIKASRAETGCVSEVAQAREKAELASEEAKRAQSEAAKAQSVARGLEQQLRASKESGADLIRQTRMAQERADSAIKAAEEAEAKADELRRELEEKTTMLRSETHDILKAFEEDRALAEERFQDLLASQEASARNRERILIAFAGVLIILIGIVIFLARYRSTSGRPARRADGDKDDRHTELHREELAEYVLDGRDDDGIRYLLRISGDQLAKSADGIIIGRNPKDSPYIINHADVSRKHARIKVMKNRVFIEDLGSTNGTSVNGQSIDDKGLVSVNNGDQIIIGSVVMKLRVLDA